MSISVAFVPPLPVPLGGVARLFHLLMLAVLALTLSGATALVEACACCAEESVAQAHPGDESAAGHEDCRDDGCAMPCARCACEAPRLFVVAAQTPLPWTGALAEAVVPVHEGDPGRLHTVRIFTPPRAGA